MGDLARAIKKGVSEANKTKKRRPRRKKEEPDVFEGVVALFKILLFVALFLYFYL